jgi:hypothetical protein
MKATRHFIFYSFVFLMNSYLLFAQSPVYEMNLRFKDSKTGFAVMPDEVLIYDAATNQRFDRIESSEIEPRGGVSIALPQAVYWLLISSGGYQPMTAKLFAGDPAVSKYVFNLDPLAPPAELETARIASLRREDATLVSGFVTDEETGRPLPDVKVYSPQTAAETATDSRGYFLIYLPADAVSGTLLFERPGYIIQERVGIELWPGGDWLYRIFLSPGEGKEIINDSKSGQDSASSQSGSLEEENCQDCNSRPDTGEQIPRTDSPANQTLALLPNTIRVGRDCPGPTTCSYVEVYGLQTYCKYVLPAEWFSCWGSLSNGMNSLQAGSVAIRSYAVWHVYHPLASGYDICDNTFCQFLGSAQHPDGNIAVDATERYVLVTNGTNITRSEYSAENNNSGCGNGWSGTGSTWPCIYDPVCQDMPTNGHGRGMCQWGSARWANGTKILPSSPCTPGVPHGFGTKTWQEILDHYYPDYQLVEGAAASIVSLTPVPATASPGQTFSIYYNLQATPAMSLMLGASLRPSSGGAWIDDPAHDRKVNVNAGSNNVFRLFSLPGNAAYGDYDILAALWYDVDNNNQINSGDFVFDMARYNQALIVGPTAIEPLSSAFPEKFSLEQNYPNPFNPRTTIAFSLPKSGKVTLKIFDALGKEITTLLNQNLSAGQYRAVWETPNVPAGVYFYRLTFTDENGGETSYIETKKMILTK